MGDVAVGVVTRATVARPNSQHPDPLSDRSGFFIFVRDLSRFKGSGMVVQIPLHSALHSAFSNKLITWQVYVVFPVLDRLHLHRMHLLQSSNPLS